MAKDHQSLLDAAPRVSPEEERRREKRHSDEVLKWDHHWQKVAEQKDWDTVIADPAVYRYAGQTVKGDPRRTPEYREQVLKGLKLGPGDTREGLSPEDMEAVREVVGRKAASFWLEGSPRTTLRHLYHDTVPTGPPVRTPQHRLKGEEAEWVGVWAAGAREFRMGATAFRH